MSGPIAFVCGSWPPLKCGVGDFSHRLAVELAGQGREIVVLTHRGALADAPPGVRVLPVMRTWRPVALPALIGAVRRAGVTAVNLHYPTELYGRLSAVDLAPAALRVSLQLPVVTTIHEFTTFRRLGRLRVRLLAQASAAVIVPDPGNLRALTTAAPRIVCRTHHVPLGPTIEPNLPADFDRDAWRATQRIGPDTLVLAYFGFISPSKGVDTLLAALNRLPADLAVHLWLLADRAPSNPRYAAYHNAVAAQLAASPYADRMTWTGYLTAQDLSLYLAAADLAVLPYTDGASLRRTTMLAALAHGLPVLSTGVEPPCAGVQVVPVGDDDALAGAITRFGRDRQALAGLAADAHAMATNFSWPAIARKTAAVFDAVAP